MIKRVLCACAGAMVLILATSVFIACELLPEDSTNPWFPLSGRLEGTWKLDVASDSPEGSASDLVVSLDRSVDPSLNGETPPESFCLTPRVYWYGQVQWQGHSVAVQLDTMEPGVWLRAVTPDDQAALVLGPNAAAPVWMLCGPDETNDILYVRLGASPAELTFVRG